jgi:hypothetical protein
MSDNVNMYEAEALDFAKEYAERLRELYLTEATYLDDTIHLNLVELCYMLGGDIETVGGTSYQEYAMLEAREDGRFLVRLRIADHPDVKYESSLRLATIIGDWILNFQDAEPGTTCRTDADYRNNNSLEYRCAVRFGWNLLLPDGLFESTWWMYGCNEDAVGDVLNVYFIHVLYRARQLGLPERTPYLLGGRNDEGEYVPSALRTE